MAAIPITLLYRPTPTQIDTIILDAAVSIRHTGTNEITDHPVEEGANISDHIRENPDRVTIQGIVSNTPISRTQALRAAEAFGVQFTSNAPPTPGGVPGYAENAYKQLLALKKGKVLTITTPKRTYQNMAIESLDVPEDAKQGDAVNFTVALKQIRVVANRTTKVVLTDEPKAQPVVTKGTQVPKQTTPGKPGYDDWLGQIKDTFDPSSKGELPSFLRR